MTERAHLAADSPRAFADKAAKPALLGAIRLALRVESPAVRRNTQTFNSGRYTAVAALPDYDALKDRARAVKDAAIAHLPELIAQLEASVTRNGGHFYLAANARDASRYVAEVCRLASVRLIVKGKSMTSEEAGLNRALAAIGIEVAETDLAEFILQAADEQPSHIIAPAIHYSRERITELFHRVFRTSQPLDTGEELTVFARERLRQKFLRADAGITGANFVVADSGSLVLVESEANIRMTTLLPPLHIAISGLEKIIPARADLAPFIELLAASATGQPMSSYTSVITPPLAAATVLTDGAPSPPREFHMVLLDNGRMKMRGDPVLREALDCLRCGACLNSCANFQTVGGHAFGGETYSGGIGGSWEAGTRGILHARFSELCTGCARCLPQCPVRIDIPWLNTVLRRRIFQNESSAASRAFSKIFAGLPEEDAGAPLAKIFFGRYDAAAKWGSRVAGAANWLNGLGIARALFERILGLDRRRRLPPFASPTLAKAVARSPRSPRAPGGASPAKAVLFADVFTNYGSPRRGLATLRVLESLGADVAVSEVCADGRAALSQGLIATAARQARRTAILLDRFIEDGRDIVVVEPSVLAMFRLDYRHLLEMSEDRALFERISTHCFDPAEYVARLLAQLGRAAASVFHVEQSPRGAKIFCHSHCQQKTIGCAAAVESLLRDAGFDLVASQVECCGMAGSFGYKKDFYELSMAVGEDLFAQVRRAEAEGGPRTLVASGTSCHEQLEHGLQREVLHPMELLAEIVDARA